MFTCDLQIKDSSDEIRIFKASFICVHASLSITLGSRKLVNFELGAARSIEVFPDFYPLWFG